MSHFSTDNLSLLFDFHRANKNNSHPTNPDNSGNSKEDQVTSYENISRSLPNSEPTVELNHPIESGILPNIEDQFDYNSETEEVVFPFDINDFDIDHDS